MVDAPPGWKVEPARRELLRLYEETDRVMSHLSCDASTDCCHFARTGREPYPTAVELAELAHALAVAPIAGSKKRALPQAERRCPLLSAEGRCSVYASRPFGCRTFFCDRAQGGKAPRAALRELAHRIADLSARRFPKDPGPRPLSRALTRS